MNVQTAYNEWSRSYDTDENATRDLDRQVTRHVLGGLRFESVIEFGCGTGKNTEFFSGAAGKVRALDFSAGMLARAKENLGQPANVIFSVADITERWPCEGESAGLISCNLILEHVPGLAHVFSEAARVLAQGGHFFICELHPFRQYQGTVANFHRGGQTTQIAAFVHHISEFLECARNAGFVLKSLQEWWHEKDEGKPPRLVSFLFEKTGREDA